MDKPQTGAEEKPFRREAWRAVGAVLFDGFVVGAPGAGFLLSAGWGLARVVAGLRARAGKRVEAGREFARAGIYAGAAALVVAVFLAQNAIGRHNAERVIAAVKSYHAREGRYPDRLQQIVGRDLPSIPPCAYRLFVCNYWFITSATGRHILAWLEWPPYGRPGYIFETGTWEYAD